jgi:hypothetical protein
MDFLYFQRGSSFLYLGTSSKRKLSSTIPDNLSHSGFVGSVIKQKIYLRDQHNSGMVTTEGERQMHAAQVENFHWLKTFCWQLQNHLAYSLSIYFHRPFWYIVSISDYSSLQQETERLPGFQATTEMVDVKSDVRLNWVIYTIIMVGMSYAKGEVRKLNNQNCVLLEFNCYLTTKKWLKGRS